MTPQLQLVQAYLHVNGYLTVTGFPLAEAAGVNEVAQTLDVLAFRFPGAGRLIPTERSNAHWCATDPALNTAVDLHDIILASVTGNGPPEHVSKTFVHALLQKFGCCKCNDDKTVAESLLTKGHITTPCGRKLRHLWFGDDPPESDSFEHVPFRYVVQYLREFVRNRWDNLDEAKLADPAFAYLVALERGERTPEVQFPLMKMPQG